ncbi:hypothetical protein KIPB_005272 [Kipferlia bialata]|uniref:Uncharacterized protein n=1 Tax=Kipferlia bialata TaxID=797122 RepID=A0A9K3GIX4_9EUKA|nr:hypothetical protein KIPB_005272 [Kipferlia bialata]|eukprot:g5272.t1
MEGEGYPSRYGSCTREVFVESSTPHSLYQSYRGHLTRLYQSTADAEYSYDEPYATRVPSKLLVRGGACVVGLGGGSVMYIQRRHCRVVDVVGIASLNTLYDVANEDLGTRIPHPLSLVEIPGVYNPITMRGAEDVDPAPRRVVCTHTHAAALLGNCVYYICRVDIGWCRYNQWLNPNYDVHGMRVFECPLDTMEWREIGVRSREKGEWFPEGYTENVCVVGDTIVCEMQKGSKQSLWAFDPQHSDGSDIHIRDPLTQREEIWAEIDRRLTCLYVTFELGTEREDWHPSYHNNDWKPILAAHSRESLYCIIAEGSRECVDRGYVIRLTERALEEVYGFP